MLQQDPIIGLWSGDASMFSKEVMFKVATGYNEGEVTHRGNLHQSDMDSEILWNLRAKGKELRLIEAPYFHIYHGDRPPRDTTHSRLKYTNKDDWGFVEYNNIDINDNTVLIYGKEATLEYDE